MITRDELDEIAKRLTDKGKLIEAGFVGLRKAAMDPEAPEIQVREMRMAFMAGAQHLFGSIMSILDPGDDVTDRDLERMAKISEELDQFYHEFTASIQTKGRA